jgi:hypothetical protein
MATVNASVPVPIVRLPVDENAFPVWRDAFDLDTRRKLVDEDLNAGRSVTAVLVTIVTGGLLLGASAVAIIVAYGI